MKKKPFKKPLPKIDVTHPDWPEEFTKWWWEKCAYYNIDPIKAFENMLKSNEK